MWEPLPLLKLCLIIILRCIIKELVYLINTTYSSVLEMHSFWNNIKVYFLAKLSQTLKVPKRWTSQFIYPPTLFLTRFQTNICFCIVAETVYYTVHTLHSSLLVAHSPTHLKFLSHLMFVDQLECCKWI